ncbi:MAG: alpha/beta fold hydrolase [Caulobacteraceae bacterium]
MTAKAPPEFDPAQAPLARFAGEPPPAPEWFTKALAVEAERGFTQVDGANIETLTWGERGKPGLVFLHGNGAHAGWWSFIAPYFAQDWRVVAFSYSGMGGSDWRDSYSTYGFVDELHAVAEGAGLFDGGAKPILVGHSMGAAISLAAAGKFGTKLRGAVLADPPFRTPERMKQWRDRRAESPPRTFPKRLYKTLPDALARFRFLPPQASEHPYIVDHIARGSVRQVDGGWSWRFDPQLWSKMTFSDLSPVLADPGCPLALMHGERSRLADGDDLAHMWDTAPEGTPVVIVPDADHHLMVDQPIAFVAALRGLLAGWPG